MLSLAIANCAGPADHDAARPNGADHGMTAGGAGPHRAIENVLADHTPELMAVPGVAIVYQGETGRGEPCITVGVEARTPAIERALPDSLEGYPVVIQETGKIAPR